MMGMLQNLLLVLFLVGPIYSKFKVRPNACDKGKYILSKNRKTWVLAKEACEEFGLQLAMVRSKVEVVEMKAAIVHFLGPRDVSLRTFSNKNWIWLGGNDLRLEGNWEWLDRTLVEDWDVPWNIKVGKDNANHIGGLDGQNALSFSRWGEFDDSYHDHQRKKRSFACQCPGT